MYVRRIGLPTQGAASYIFPAVSSWNFSNTLQPFATLIIFCHPCNADLAPQGGCERKVEAHDVRYVHYSQPSSNFVLGLTLLTRIVAPTCTAQHFPTIFPTLVIFCHTCNSRNPQPTGRLRCREAMLEKQQKPTKRTRCPLCVGTSALQSTFFILRTWYRNLHSCAYCNLQPSSYLVLRGNLQARVA